MLKGIMLFGVVLLFTTTNEVCAQKMPPPSFIPPKQYYLALGDSLAFGFRFDIFNQYVSVVPPDVLPQLFVGYVDDFGTMLRTIRPSIDTVNFGCVGETTDTFIHGGCLYTTLGFSLHDSYSGSQLNAALEFLRSHPGEVSPITFNLGGNDLNALTTVCQADFSCYLREAPRVLERIASNLDQILDALRAAALDSEIITFTNYNVAFLSDARFLLLTDAFNAIVRATGATHRVRVGEVFAAFNGGPQPATICSLSLICTLGDSHPNDAGYAAIAAELWEASGYDRLGH